MVCHYATECKVYKTYLHKHKQVMAIAKESLAMIQCETHYNDFSKTFDSNNSKLLSTELNRVLSHRP